MALDTAVNHLAKLDGLVQEVLEGLILLPEVPLGATVHGGQADLKDRFPFLEHPEEFARLIRGKPLLLIEQAADILPP